jgi:hypothetical protein
VTVSVYFQTNSFVQFSLFWLALFLKANMHVGIKVAHTACTGQVRAFRRTFGTPGPTADSASGGFLRQFPPLRVTQTVRRLPNTFGNKWIHIMESEEKLAGGNMTAVSRIGNTVRRDVGFWTKQVHMLLAHLRAKGIQEVPTPLGFDEQGREILTFIPGLVGHSPLPELRTDKILISAARLLRRIHDATEDIAQIYLSG